MRNPLFKIVGSIISVLMFVEVWLQVLVALRSGQAFYGENYKWLPLGTYSSLIGMTVVTVALIWIAAKTAVAKLRRSSGRRLNGRVKPGHDATK